MELAAAMAPNWTLVFPSPQGSGNPSSMMGSLGKAGITVELGGNCRTLTNDFHVIAQDLADSYLNVMRHYQMIDGQARYAASWRQGYQIVLLAPTTGMFVGTPDPSFETDIKEGTVLGQIHDLFGELAAAVKAPAMGSYLGFGHAPLFLRDIGVASPA
jgi:predicted deacylase